MDNYETPSWNFFHEFHGLVCGPGQRQFGCPTCSSIVLDVVADLERRLTLLERAMQKTHSSSRNDDHFDVI